ncbi:MAG: T9SS type A sorting domain-containing protein [Ignavibacteriales bacterium]|nr:T9SS type A sorting domain-containing protein [Ignavibacteriales bacterium]
MRKALLFVLLAGYVIAFAGDGKENGNTPKANPPIYIAFLWHMHQPIYWPYESIVQTDANSRFPFSVTDIHNQRTGPYTSWPRNAVEKGITANLPHFGAQVSFTGSLIENLNNLEVNGNGNFSNWKSNWNAIRPKKTSLNNPRMDLVAFGYFHPLMGLIDYQDIRKQIQYHKNIFTQNFPGTYSKGMFPPENAFTNRMIPALVAEGIEWILVDNVHFDRACVGYPFSTVGNIYEPNKADQLNPNPNDWVQLNGLWAPTKNSAKWGRQPHWVEYVDPATGTKTKMIAVPADRYMGNEDGRGGFGALNYENVMSQLESYNTDPNHPILIVLHHDGDNYGGGSEGYYGGNFQSFVNWVQANPSRFVCSTVQDYLQMFPPAETDIIHIEEGSWSGADNGDPEFKKWLGDPDAQGYSPDRNSWGVLTAAKNLVFTAEQNDPNNANTQTAWKNLLCGEASDYWYWDGSLGGIWDTHPTRAANLAIQAAQLVSGTDNTPPTIFIPQREPYNPGGTEWNISQTSNMSVWSYVFDKSGLQSVTLKYRVDSDGSNSAANIDNETYAGGTDVGSWIDVTMTGADKPSSTNPPPVLKAKEFTASIDGLKSKLIDYYIEAVDNNNNTAKTPIRHCWIGDGSGSGGTGNLNISWVPLAATKNDTITVVVKNASTGAKLHWGVNNTGATWQMPDSAYWPAGTVKFGGTGPAVESPFVGPDTAGTLTLKIGPFNLAGKVVDRVAFVIHFNDNTWNNNGGNDYHITFDTSGSAPISFVMDGQLDSKTITASTSGTEHLYIGWNGTDLYVATESAQASGNDAFIFVSDSLRGLIAAPWGKAGKVAQWGAYLANESTNNYVTWSDATGTNAKAAGAILEGTLRINGEFGYIPAKLYIAVGKYATTDGGALQKQLPAGNGNGDIESVEFYAFDYVTVGNAVTRTLRPVSLELMQNYPNPFNPSTVINYYLPKNGKTLLKVYDVIGNEVRTLVDQEQEQGIHYAQFDATGLSSGVYYYTLTSGGERLTRKMLLVK